MGILWNHTLKSKICTENKVETVLKLTGLTGVRSCFDPGLAFPSN